MKKIPKFKDEDRERDFWASNSPLDYFDLSKAKRLDLPDLKPSLKSISLRLPEGMIGTLKAIANSYDVPYQSLIKMLLARGIEVGVVSNWDIGLTEQLERLGVASLFTAIVTTAEAGAPKPEPAVFRLALEKLGVDAGRAVHVGDEPGDEDGARAAGMQFAPTPLATAFAGWS